MVARTQKERSDVLIRLSQQFEDYLANEKTRVEQSTRRVNGFDAELENIKKERSSKTETWLRTLIPVLISLLIVAGGYIWGISRMSAQVSELEGGRAENRANIQQISADFQKNLAEDAVRDERYKIITDKLEKIESRIDKLATAVRLK